MSENIILNANIMVPNEPKISYKINSNTGKSFVLDEPHLLTGKGAVSMLDPAPKNLFFSNSTSGATAKDIKIQVLVGRNAISATP